MTIFSIITMVLLCYFQHTYPQTTHPLDINLPWYTAYDKAMYAPKMMPTDQPTLRYYLNLMLTDMTMEILKDTVTKFSHVKKYTDMYHGTVNFEIGLFATEIKVVFVDMVKLYRYHSNRSKLNIFNDDDEGFSPSFQWFVTHEMFFGFFKMHSLYNQVLYLRRRFYQTIDYYEFLRLNKSMHKKSTLVYNIAAPPAGARRSDMLVPYYDSSENTGDYDLDYFGHRIFKSTKPHPYTLETTKERLKLLPIDDDPRRRPLHRPSRLRRPKTIEDWNSFVFDLTADFKNDSLREQMRARLRQIQGEDKNIENNNRFRNNDGHESMVNERQRQDKDGNRFFRKGKRNKQHEEDKSNESLSDQEYKKQMRWRMYKKTVGNFSPGEEGIDVELDWF